MRCLAHWGDVHCRAGVPARGSGPMRVFCRVHALRLRGRSNHRHAGRGGGGGRRGECGARRRVTLCVLRGGFDPHLPYRGLRLRGDHHGPRLARECRAIRRLRLRRRGSRGLGRAGLVRGRGGLGPFGICRVGAHPVRGGVGLRSLLRRRERGRESDRVVCGPCPPRRRALVPFRRGPLRSDSRSTRHRGAPGRRRPGIIPALARERGDCSRLPLPPPGVDGPAPPDAAVGRDRQWDRFDLVHDFFCVRKSLRARCCHQRRHHGCYGRRGREPVLGPGGAWGS
mmetsp:Transcript_53785/g.170851  ORF Transcript_53785/g.170851 Transcript_53785/m.170851 type:complete len:283 (-) Transcript_53785:1032-1880(-)